jgi:hypothetical protein
MQNAGQKKNKSSEEFFISPVAGADKQLSFRQEHCSGTPAGCQKAAVAMKREPERLRTEHGAKASSSSCRRFRSLGGDCWWSDCAAERWALRHASRQSGDNHVRE